jgi:predicted DNA-binding transcriptional regulator AlpA|tara:strand:- start:61 stop:369 length:309 start_codon:yes stop_codon:yes gene_type:complete
MENSKRNQEEEQIFNLKVSELKELIKSVVLENLPTHKTNLKKESIFDKPILTLKEVMKLFGVTRQTIYTWISVGFLKRKKIGGSIFFKTSEIIKTLNSSDTF